VNQPVHWFLGCKGLGIIQQGTNVRVGSPKSVLGQGSANGLKFTSDCPTLVNYLLEGGSVAAERHGLGGSTNNVVFSRGSTCMGIVGRPCLHVILPPHRLKAPGQGQGRALKVASLPTVPTQYPLRPLRSRKRKETPIHDSIRELVT
jgi:hypothetical protein